MPEWDFFIAATGVLVLVLLGLTRATTRMLGDLDGESSSEGDTAVPGPTAVVLDTRSLYLNVLLTHGVLGGLLVSAALHADVPAEALGVVVPDATALAWGVGLAGAMALLAAAAAPAIERIGLPYDESLRGLLAPRTRLHWAVLGLVILPLVAMVEELLFRGVLIGGVDAAYGPPEVVLLVGSAILFGLAHGLQRAGGVLVATLLGLVLGGAFLVTRDLAVVIIGHYLVNVIEFLRHRRGG